MPHSRGPPIWAVHFLFESIVPKKGPLRAPSTMCVLLIHCLFVQNVRSFWEWVCAVCMWQSHHPDATLMGANRGANARMSAEDNEPFVTFGKICEVSHMSGEEGGNKNRRTVREVHIGHVSNRSKKWQCPFGKVLPISQTPGGNAFRIYCSGAHHTDWMRYAKVVPEFFQGSVGQDTAPLNMFICVDKQF